MRMRVAVVKESAPGERRVALVPEAVAKLRAAGLEILVESGAGDGAWVSDDAFTEAGASIVAHEEFGQAADAIVMVGRPDDQVMAGLRSGCWPRSGIPISRSAWPRPVSPPSAST
jgi:NAD(P) transhydrogenase subunit alpha